MESLAALSNMKKAVALVSVDGLVISNTNTAAPYPILSSENAASAAQMASAALKLSSSSALSTQERAITSTSTAQSVLPFTDRAIPIGESNTNFTCLGADDRKFAAAVSESGFKGIVIETTTRTIRVGPVVAGGSEKVDAAGFLVVSELLA